MNTDEKIAAILRMEADAVEPSAAGYDAIKTGIAARQRRTWWMRGSAFAGTALATAAALVFVTTTGDTQSIEPGPASPGPSVSGTVDTSPTVAPTVAPKPDADPLGAIWPLTTYGELREWQADRETYPALATVSASAAGFAHNYLLSPDATVASVDERDGSFFFEMRRGTIVVSTLELRGFGDGGTAPFLVVAARSEAVTISTPAAGATVSSPLRVSGTYRTTEPSFLARLRGDDSGSKPAELGDALAVYSEPNTWSAELAYETTLRTGSLMVTMLDGRGDGFAAAAVVPLTFAPQTPGTPTGDVFAGVRSNRIAVFRSDGTLLRYLTGEQPGGVYHPDVSPDGTRVVWSHGSGTCAHSAMYAPVGGGEPVAFGGDGKGRAWYPVWVGDGKIAYSYQPCDAEAGELRLYDVATRSTRTLDSLPEAPVALAGSTDGKHLAVLLGSGIETYEVATGSTRRVTPTSGCAFRSVDIAGTTTTNAPILVTAETCPGNGTVAIDRFAVGAPDRDRVAEVKHDGQTYRVSFDAPSGVLLVSVGVEDAPSYTERFGRNGKLPRVENVYDAAW